MNMAHVSTFRRVLLSCLASLSLCGFVDARDLPAVDVASIAAKYGAPDKVTSTAGDKPRPPLVTQFVEYRKEGVRFVLLADAPVGSPPPYRKWVLMGVQDIKTKSKLTADEVTERMKGRRKP